MPCFTHVNLLKVFSQIKMADIEDVLDVPMTKMERLRHARLNYGKQMAKATESIDKVGDAVESFFGQIFIPK